MSQQYPNWADLSTEDFGIQCLNCDHRLGVHALGKPHHCLQGAHKFSSRGCKCPGFATVSFAENPVDGSYEPDLPDIEWGER